MYHNESNLWMVIVSQGKRISWNIILQSNLKKNMFSWKSKVKYGWSIRDVLGATKTIGEITINQPTHSQNSSARKIEHTQANFCQGNNIKDGVTRGSAAASLKRTHTGFVHGFHSGNTDKSALNHHWTMFIIRPGYKSLKYKYPYLTLPPDLHPLCRGTIQGPLYVEVVLQNYIQWFILHQTHIYVHRLKRKKRQKSSGNALHIYLQSIR